MHTWVHFVEVVGGAGLILVTLPPVMELLVLSVAAMLPGRRLAGKGAGVRLAVVIPAHNEEALIGRCVGSLAGANEIYVVAHNCTDRTAEVAEAAGARAVALTGEGGKGVALDFGFRQALAEGADAVLVVDADSVAEAGLVEEVRSAFAAGAEALQCRYEVANAGATGRTRLAALAFLGMNVLRPLGRERLGLSCGIFGNGFGLAVETLRKVPYTANSLVEDLEYHLHLVRTGVRVRFVNTAKVLGEMPEAGTAASTQRARWEGGRMLMRRLWIWPLAKEVLRGRWVLLEPLLDLLALPLATGAGLLVLALGLGVFGKLVWLTYFAGIGLAVIGMYVLVAAGLGPEPARTLGALGFAPAYLIWKALMIPKTRLAARRDAKWVRTARNADSDEQSGA